MLFIALPEDIKPLHGKNLNTTLTGWILRKPFYSLDSSLDEFCIEEERPIQLNSLINVHAVYI